MDASPDDLRGSVRLLLAYQRIIVDQFHDLSLAMLGVRRDLRIPLAELYVRRTVMPLHAGSNRIELLPAAPDLPRETIADLAGTPGARLLLIGEPGSGKTTCLRRLALACAASAFGGLEQAANLVAHWLDPLPLPILVEARALDAAQPYTGAAQPMEHAGLPFSALWAALALTLRAADLGALAPALERCLEHGAALVLIDGLDDLVEAAGDAATPAIEQLIARYPANRYLITCRDPAMAAPLARLGFVPHVLGPLDESQMDEMVARWCNAIARSGATPRAETVPALVTTLQGHLRLDNRLRGLARRPLALALCILAYLDGWRLPAAQGIISQRLLDLLLDRWEQIRSAVSAPDLARALDLAALDDVDRRLALLEPLAFAILAHSTTHQLAALRRDEVETLIGAALATLGIERHLAIEQVVPRLIARCCRLGILAEAGAPPTYTMPDLVLCEYLAARALAQQPDFPLRAYELRSDSRWRPAIRLAVQELGRRGAAQPCQDLLSRLLASSREHADGAPLVLAAECLLALGEQPQIVEPARPAIQRALVTLLGRRECPVAERITAGMLLGQIGDPRFGSLRSPLIEVAGGPFVLGADTAGYDDEGPAQWIDLPAFAIGVYPVTNGEYARFLVDNPGYPLPHYWHDPRFNNPSQPVVGVTWHDAVAYTQWLTHRLDQAGLLPAGRIVRLPLEAEWEKAASWDTLRQHKRRYPWGEQWDAARANTAEGRQSWVVAPVGCYPDGVSAYGVHDMVGNVWEWTASEYASYPGALAPFYEAGSYVLRGLSCVSLPTHARCTYRARLPADYWRYHLGFRIVLGPPLDREAP